ncbi:hypothetical protein XAP412_360021 [Xanthomonas phaseoli pv. phaseoli]|uniref:Secreted protein n=1 Tax=Xanthomonas campestris pv. phaseoli TaxID=317013 RepID=A0AB38E127_XANCH|nr:hypothetical protein XAP6984_420021 [Xanthomonas phaseoli pv. phaseoli]SON84459.1 hypothetical protein XAP412_360021 [Xanthomonas phaseoli pv. phaseoli]SON88929.1 hypothetical protein XAP7430_400038 [Xanthomonas phaseoli pv. phaseoli]SOO27628.1 hypothetical protein XAP6164_1760002 [Xanthomonas phaseoli pv. phaseoli]
MARAPPGLHNTRCTWNRQSPWARRRAPAPRHFDRTQRRHAFGYQAHVSTPLFIAMAAVLPAPWPGGIMAARARLAPR